MGEETRERERGLLIEELKASQKTYLSARELAERLDIPAVVVALALHELVTSGVLLVDHSSRPPAYRLAPGRRG